MKIKITLILFALLLALSVLPALAQDDAAQSHTVSYDGFSFMFDSAFASNVNITQYAGDPAEFGVGFAEVQHTAFTFYDQFPAPESWFDAKGGIRVYNTADFAGYEAYPERLAQLQTLIAEQSDLSQFMIGGTESELALPFLPTLAAAQVIRARAQVVETEDVMGISYISIYQQAQEPFLANSFFYTFQGVSKDGVHYISVLFPVTTTYFPTEIGADFNMESFQAGFVDYVGESIATLNAAAPEDFTPSLATLDALIATFAFRQ